MKYTSFAEIMRAMRADADLCNAAMNREPQKPTSLAGKPEGIEAPGVLTVLQAIAAQPLPIRVLIQSHGFERDDAESILARLRRMGLIVFIPTGSPKQKRGIWQITDQGRDKLDEYFAISQGDAPPVQGMPPALSDVLRILARHPHTTEATCERLRITRDAALTRYKRLRQIGCVSYSRGMKQWSITQAGEAALAGAAQ